MKVKGAEATVEIEADKAVKKREPKKYRHRKLDKRLRTERTETELKLMEEARRHNVSVPEAEEVDSSTIEMEKVDGEPLKKVLGEEIGAMGDLGKNVALLHDTDIIHGDLTTSNAILDEELFLIDFGLAFRSQRIEDKAVDIHLLKQVLNSSHPEVAEEAWENFLNGYQEYEKADKVLEQLEEVEQRGRYK